MLVPVDARYLAREWPFVRAGLEKVIAKLHDDWLPEDVYTEIRSGNTGLFILEYACERIGFVCLQIWPAHHSGPRLFVRALWTMPGKGLKHRCDIYDDLREFARAKGCVVMRQQSPRRWDGDGWTMKQFVYEMDVDPPLVDPYVTAPNPYAEDK